MTNEELQTATDLALVRQMRSINDTLDASVGEHIKDEEHATVRRLFRSWEQRLQESIKVRAKRSQT